jgi:hypothetical protein
MFFVTAVLWAMPVHGDRGIHVNYGTKRVLTATASLVNILVDYN